MTTTDRPARVPQGAGAAVAVFGVLACIMLAANTEGSLLVTALAGIGIQVATAVVIIRGARRTLCLTSALAVVWLITFTLRLVQLSFAPNLRYHHPIIVASSDATRSWVWVLTTLAFAAFGTGVLLARRAAPPRASAHVDIPRHRVYALFYVFIGVAYLVAFLHINSGIVENFAQFYLFLIAYASYTSAQEGRSVGAELMVVMLTSLLALEFGFKEFAVLPVAAWILGHLAARRRILSVGAVAVVMIAVVFYVAIQAQRSAEILGENPSITAAFRRGLTEYDLATGTYEHKSGFSIVTNIGSAISSRLLGVDAIFLIHDKVPSVIPFQHGKSIWEPLVSVIPGTSQFLSPDFRTVSLAHYATFNFWSLSPNTDESSQTLTVVGDIWLNFGTLGVVIGLALFGMLYALIDRYTEVDSATMAGVFAYATIPMLIWERNVAYLLLGGVIRYAVAFTMIVLLRRWSAGRDVAPAPAVAELDLIR